MRSFLEADKVVSLAGRLSVEEDKAPVIIVEKISEFTLEEESTTQKITHTVDYSSRYADTQPISSKVAKAKEAEVKTLWLNVAPLEEEDLEELLETLTFYEGETVVYFVKNGKKMLCTQKVSLNKALIAELASFLPEYCIKIL